MSSSSIDLRKQAANGSLRQHQSDTELRDSLIFAEGTEKYQHDSQWPSVLKTVINTHLQRSGTSITTSKTSVHGCCILVPPQRDESGIHLKLLSVMPTSSGYRSSKTVYHYDPSATEGQLTDLEGGPTEALNNSSMERVRESSSRRLPSPGKTVCSQC